MINQLSENLKERLT